MDVGAIISIADITIRACVSLARFIGRCRHAGETKSNLLKRVDLLHQLLEAVSNATTTRGRQLDIKPVSDGEKAILKLFKSALERCKATIEKMTRKLERLGNGDAALSGRERVQVALDLQKSALEAFEKDIDENIMAIQVAFNCLSP